ncbi:small ribosomal subunit biogenesis GTPase RsgA [Litoribrevibacter albus]|uniref:Small ribosomal subunit biogenesis GTPase RsgA n=1 Tax=Litoribrevibacter albus TaxID=1473156 RepID=A0AA37W4Z1_9GAMM|nr:small ribosomal subunit biogenesis GTPase RsgA [Litoribrevibacter albus]GLQ30627.1 putative ribosome biogenesis GTPase RsgA [Litoribrevibacter albus]
MAKRKLTRQQSWRIKKIQDERTKRAEQRDAKVEQALNESDLGTEQTGRVVSHFGVQVDVEAFPYDHTQPEIIRCHKRSNLGDIVTGDLVTWRQGQDDMGVIVAVNERQNQLSRPGFRGEMKLIAANIDQMMVVIAPEPEPHQGLVDRYFIAAEYWAIEPILVINKADLFESSPYKERLERLNQLYTSLGYKVITASSQTEAGLNDLYSSLKDKTSVFVGQSGVGKSSLINVLLPGSDIQTGELSETSRKGKHTTTTARLYHFPTGGDLIDSPGIRELSLTNLDKDTILEGFKELHPFIGNCKFRNCNHESEPQCAIREAYDSGAISEERYTSLWRIIDSLEEE